MKALSRSSFGLQGWGEGQGRTRDMIYYKIRGHPFAKQNETNLLTSAKPHGTRAARIEPVPAIVAELEDGPEGVYLFRALPRAPFALTAPHQRVVQRVVGSEPLADWVIPSVKSGADGPPPGKSNFKSSGVRSNCR